jgi:hypothetical protein
MALVVPSKTRKTAGSISWEVKPCLQESVCEARSSIRDVDSQYTLFNRPAIDMYHYSWYISLLSCTSSPCKLFNKQPAFRGSGSSASYSF